MERDEKIQGLLTGLNEVFEFMKQAEPLNNIDLHKKNLTALAQQAADCGYFITSYAKNKNFCKHVSINISC